jgi:hypothetical protein
VLALGTESLQVLFGPIYHQPRKVHRADVMNMTPLALILRLRLVMSLLGRVVVAQLGMLLTSSRGRNVSFVGYSFGVAARYEFQLFGSRCMRLFWLELLCASACLPYLEFTEVRALYDLADTLILSS